MLRILNSLASIDVGATLRAWALTSDNDGVLSNPDTITVTVELPDGSSTTGTATAETIGQYLVTYDVVAEGLHLIKVSTTSAAFGDDVNTWSVVAYATQPNRPTLLDVRTYLGETSYGSKEIEDALDAESAAQIACCRIPAAYPSDLAQALKRRVARNLAARGLPVASYTSFEGGATVSKLTKADPEIARLEAPYARLVIA